MNFLKRSCVQKDYIWNPSRCFCKNGEYLVSITDDSVITCNEIIETQLTNPTETVANKSFLYFTCLFINCYNIIISS